MRPKKQVSSVIRISQRERDASARATHLEAATRKFLVTTHERKQMSTKTNFKRIALVAVAALGLGVLSSVPAQATIDAAAVVTVVAGSGTTNKTDSTTAATIAFRYFASGGNGAAATGTDDTATIQVSLGSKPAGASFSAANASSSGESGTILMTLLDTATSSGGIPVYTGKPTTTAWQGASGVMGADSMTVATGTGRVAPSAVGFVYSKWGFFLDTRVAASNKVAGTYTFDYVIRIFSGGVLDTGKGQSGSVNYVVTEAGAAAAGAVSAAGTSTALMSTGATYSTVTVDDTVSVSDTPSSSAPVAVIRVTQKQADGTPSRESITVTTSIGNVGTTSAATGKTVTFIGDASGIQDIGIFADGTSGVATITIKTTSVTFTNKSATFYSDTVDNYVVTQLATVIGSSAANALLVVTKDAKGNQILGNTSTYAYSSDLNVIATGGTAAVPTGTACSYSASSGGHICSLTGSADGTASITIKNKSTGALSTKSSTAVTMTVNTQSAAKVSLAFDKASYAPGEAAYVRIVAVDAAGKPVGPNSALASLLSSAGITSSVAFGNGSDTTTASTINLRTTTTSTSYGSGGVIAGGYPSSTAIGLYRVYMPSSGGTVTITAKGGSILPLANQVSTTASATIADSGAAAVAASTAALAAVAALATTVASLKTLITTLTNLVLKIQKKVKA